LQLVLLLVLSEQNVLWLKTFSFYPVPSRHCVAVLCDVCCRNHAAAEAAEAAAAAAGQRPQLQALLIEPSWRDLLLPEFDKPYMTQLQTYLNDEWARGTVYPSPESVFKALNSVPLHQVCLGVCERGGGSRGLGRVGLER
jgi:hypothetical protein